MSFNISDRNGDIPVGVNVNDSTAMSRMAEFICRANSGLAYGNFELDYEDGTITYKSYTNCEDIDVSNAIIKQSIYGIAIMFDTYGKGILDVISGKLTPQEAIEMCEAEEENQE